MFALKGHKEGQRLTQKVLSLPLEEKKIQTVWSLVRQKGMERVGWRGVGQPHILTSHLPFRAVGSSHPDQLWKWVLLTHMAPFHH